MARLRYSEVHALAHLTNSPLGGLGFPMVFHQIRVRVFGAYLSFLQHGEKHPLHRFLLDEERPAHHLARFVEDRVL
jgi:hypothetical protein